MTANEAKTHFSEFLDGAQRKSLRVMRHEVGVLVGAPDHEEMRVIFADRLHPALARASAGGDLDQAALDELYADTR